MSIRSGQDVNETYIIQILHRFGLILRIGRRRARLSTRCASGTHIQSVRAHANAKRFQMIGSYWIDRSNTTSSMR